MPALTTVNIILAYVALSYLVGCVWFLVIERSDGLLKWRAIASAVAPIAVPVMCLVGIVLLILEKFFAWGMKSKSTVKQ